ncbi:hypothetical protein [Thermophilibacter sp.]|uniref:hypothetical protein n=1 Tax=Thermophilibacter sp. TaxID=2847309 RepID=UPI003A940FD6
MREREVARFERAGDVRTVSLVESADGALEVRERREGPSALVAYGEGARSLCALFSPVAASRLPDLMGGASLVEYCANEKNDLVDLMDLCDAAAVPYSFTSLGSGGEVAYRPA